MLASFSMTFRSEVVFDQELMTRRKQPPLGLVQVIWAWKGTFSSLSRSISMNLRSSSLRASYSKEILVFAVALAYSFIRMVRLSFRNEGSSLRKTKALCSMIFAVTFRPTTSSFSTFAKSYESFYGLTTFTLPLVASTTLPRISSFELSPLMVIMFTITFFSFASRPTFSQNCCLLSSAVSSDPTPMLASPSVHSTTVDPLLPFAATSIAAVRAGPRAVCPLASVLFNLFSKISKLSAMGEVRWKFLSALSISVVLLSLSPTRLTFSALPSPITRTSLLKSMKPTFLCGSAFLISLIWASMALRTHCMREMKVLFWLWAPGRQFSCASSPGYMNCLSISISSCERPNLRSTFPAISDVVFMLPETSMQKTIVESVSLPPCSSPLSSMQTTSSFTGISSFSMRRWLGQLQNSHTQRLSLGFSSWVPSFTLPAGTTSEYLFRIALHFLHSQESPPARFFSASFCPSKVRTKTLRSTSGRGGWPWLKSPPAIGAGCDCCFGLEMNAQFDAFFIQIEFFIWNQWLGNQRWLF